MPLERLPPGATQEQAEAFAGGHGELSAQTVSNRQTRPRSCSPPMRNRIARHEPVHNRPLARLRDDAMLVAEWACPGTRTWIAARSAVPRLLASRPRPTRERGS